MIPAKKDRWTADARNHCGRTHRRPLLAIAAVLLLLASCRKEGDPSASGSDRLVGKWLLYERGYSPGAGYYVNQILAVPPQTLEFASEGRLVAEGNDLAGYQNTPHYRVDTTAYGLQLALYANPEGTPSYQGLELRNDTLRLSPPCTEGCHYGFVRIGK